MSDLDVLKEIPGYKAILKSVLKSQIQLLMEQLSEHTGEESIILTASVNDGSLSHLGSNTGKGFLEGRDEIKSQFLGYCLKTYHKKKTHEPQKPYQRTHPSPRSPAQLPTPPAKRPRVHPVSISRASSQDIYPQPSEILSDASDSNVGYGNTGANTDSNLSVKTEQLDYQNSDIPQNQQVAESNESVTFTAAEKSIPESVHLSHTQTSSVAGEMAAEVDNDQEKNETERTEISDLSGIKVEQVEDELEITGVEMAASNLDNWGQGQPGFGAESDSSFDQSTDQSGYNKELQQRSCTNSVLKLLEEIRTESHHVTEKASQGQTDKFKRFVTYGQLRKILDGYVQRCEFKELKRRLENAPLVCEMEQEFEEIMKRQKNAVMAVEAETESSVTLDRKIPSVHEVDSQEDSVMGSQEHSDMEFVTYGQLREILDGYVQRSEFRELKRRMENAPLVNEMEQELEEIIKRQKNAYMAVEAGMCHLFTTEEINTHSATGKKPNRSTPAKPKFDPWRYDLMAELVKKHFGISNKEIILKTQNVKRKFAKKDY